MKQYRYNSPELQERRRVVFEKANKKAKEIVAKMTLEDKVGQCSMFSTGFNDVPTNKNIENDGSAEPTFKRVGAYLNGAGHECTNRLQRNVLRDNSQSVPVVYGVDIVHGCKTTMPTPLAQSCTWDPDLTRACQEAAAREARSIGITWTFAPMVDVARDPRWGRITEGFGEDPYLASDFSASAVVGLQGEVFGENTKEHIFACLKHFVGYGAAEGGRDYNTTDMSLQTLHDVYLPPFKAGVDAGSVTLMSAFNCLNGVPTSANHYTLWEVLREKWGFKGFVVSDYTSIHETINHGYSEDEKDAAMKGFNAGVDMVMLGNLYNDNLPDLVREGKVSEDLVTRSAEIIVTWKIIAGLFEDPFVDEETEAKTFLCEAHRKASRDAAKNAIVMLENKNKTLPLTKEKARGKKIAVIGPNIEDAYSCHGAWFGMPDFDKAVTLKQAFDEFYGDVAELTYVRGAQFYGRADSKPENDNIDEAVEACRNADYVIACLGEFGGDSGECASKSVIKIARPQIEMMKRVHQLGVPVIATVTSGRPLVLTELREYCDSLLAIWNLGTETGHAVVDVLSGAHNPSGHLTTSWPSNAGALPNHYNHLATGRPDAEDSDTYEGPRTSYEDAPFGPLYRFGYGLSYTDFEYSDLRLSADKMTADGEIEVSFKIKNVGDCAGADVAQLYIRDVAASRCRPVKELKGYKKVYLEAGEEKTVTIELPAAELAFADDKCEMKVEPGLFKLWIAKDCRDENLGTEFRVI